MPPYHPAYRAGEPVRVAEFGDLLTFHREWMYHHPLQNEQFEYAAMLCKVKRISFWHGGDCLYELVTYVRDTATNWREVEVHGFWHESCLRDQDMSQYLSRDDIRLSLANRVYIIESEIRNDQPVVIVKTLTGMECLVARHHQNKDVAENMRQVAAIRSTLCFEERYDFEGVAQDASRAAAEARHRKKECE